MEHQILTSIVIPVWNNKLITIACLDSLKKYDIQAQIIVVDNASSDGIEFELQKRALAQEIELIRNDENLGFAIATNQGIQVAQTPYILLLNNDITCNNSSWLTSMERHLSETQIGAVGACLLYPNSRMIQHAGVAVGTEKGLIRSFHIDQFQNIDLCNQAQKSRKVDSLTGACLLVKKSILNEIGLLDEKFINGYEDTDLCLRIHRAGFELFYDAEAVLDHHESATPGRRKSEVANIQLFESKWSQHFKNYQNFASFDQELKEMRLRRQAIFYPHKTLPFLKLVHFLKNKSASPTELESIFNRFQGSVLIKALVQKWIMYA